MTSWSRYHNRDHIAKLVSEMDEEARDYLIGEDEQLRKLVEERLQKPALFEER